MVGSVQPGGEFGGYRIEAVEREDASVAVLRAQRAAEGRAVALHVAGEPPGALSTVRFLERAHRLGTVDHPNLLGVYDMRTLDGRAVAVAQAPPGRRLDELLADGPLAARRRRSASPARSPPRSTRWRRPAPPRRRSPPSASGSTRAATPTSTASTPTSASRRRAASSSASLARPARGA